MLQYLIILLDERSTSYCHYKAASQMLRADGNGLIPLDVLRQGIRFAMKENLNIQFVYPDTELPEEWKKEIETIDHSKLKPSPLAFQHDEADELGLDRTDVAVVNDWHLPTDVLDIPLVVRTNKEDFFARYRELYALLELCPRVNVVFTDVEMFSDDDFETYKAVLSEMAQTVERLYAEGKTPQLNLLTDRMMLSEMNNCGAGDTNLTLAPNGCFYVCPAFYYEDAADCVGSLEDGPDIRNGQLYKLEYAPICRHCDAYQCKRCVWLNRKLTLDVNTPSRQQCVMAHLERNASRELLLAIRKHRTFLPDKDIPEMDCLDPFEERNKWNN